jgi:hypothetical protein
MLYLGPAGAAQAHAHHALQIVYGLDGPVRLTLDGDSVSTRAGIIAANTPHAFDAHGGRIALILLDAHGPRGAALTRHARQAIGGAVLPALPPLRPSLCPPRHQTSPRTRHSSGASSYCSPWAGERRIRNRQLPRYEPR